MRGINTITIIILILIASMFWTTNENKLEPTEVTEKLIIVEEATSNITKEGIKYTNLYKEKPTIRNVINNLINAGIYPITTIYNTAIPVIIHSTKEKNEMIKWIITIAILIIIATILTTIVPIISIYFFFKEKKKYKEKIID